MGLGVRRRIKYQQLDELFLITNTIKSGGEMNENRCLINEDVITNYNLILLWSTYFCTVMKQNEPWIDAELFTKNDWMIGC